MKCPVVLILLFCFSFLSAQDHQQDSLNDLIQQAKEKKSWKTTIALLYQKGKLYHKEKNYEEAQKQLLKVEKAPF